MDKVIRADLIDDFFRKSETKYDTPEREYGDPRDLTLTQLIRDQGWGLPETGDKATVDARLRNGWIEVFRGVRPRKDVTAAAQLDAMRGSPDFEYGSGIYGNGIYFSVSPDVADAFARADPDSKKSFTTEGATVRVAINPDAKIVDFDDLERERKAWWVAEDGGKRLHPSTRDLLYDVGRFAAMRGYDVIVIKGKQDGHWRKNAKGRKVQSKDTQYVVLNRGAMMVEEA